MAQNRQVLFERGEKAWLEIQIRLALKVIERVGVVGVKLDWTDTGFETKGFSSLFTMLEALHDALNAESSGNIELPPFVGPGKSRIAVGAVWSYFHDKKSGRDRCQCSWWDESGTPSIASAKSAIADVVEVKQKAQEWFRETKKSRAKESSSDGCRLRVEVSPLGYHIYLDDKPTQVNDEAAKLFQAAIAAKGTWVNMTKLGCRSEHLRRLPRPLLSLLERKRGGGTRLLQEAWSS